MELTLQQRMLIFIAMIGAAIVTALSSSTLAVTADQGFATVTPFFPTPSNMPPTPAPTPPSEWALRAVDFVSEKHAVPSENLLIVNEHQRGYPSIGRVFRAFVILDNRTAESPEYGLLIDVASGEVVEDFASIEQAEQAAYQAKYGKLQPALYERLQEISDEDMLPVAIWVANIGQGKDTNQLYSEVAVQFPQAAEALARGTKPMDVSDPALSNQIQEAYSKLVAQEIALRRQPLVEWLGLNKVSFTTFEGMPSLTATFSKAMILELAARDDVAMIYLAEAKAISHMDSAASTDRVPQVWAQNITGSGRRVAIVEQGNIAPNTGCLNISTTKRLNTAVSDHATFVAGVVGCYTDPYRGIAPGSLLIDATYNGYIDDAVAAVQWAIQQQNADVVNFSAGVEEDGNLNWSDRAFDYWARVENAIIVVSSGDSVNQNYYVTSPAKAWNVISTGGSDDKGTSNWADDTIGGHPPNVLAWPWSWINPTGGDREKPEVVAPSVAIKTVIPGGTFMDVLGVSFSAPQVSGVAALLIQRRSSLTVWPEAMKAIVMASAVNNVDGPSDIPTGQDLKDGAGSIDAVLADRIAANYASTGTVCDKPCWWGITTNNTYPPVGGYLNQYFKASRGERIRVAIAWFSQADPPLIYPFLANDALLTNYNLQVLSPSGQQAGYNASYDNNYELVDFIATETGQYTIRVIRSTIGDQNESSNSVGIAWTSDSTFIPDLRNNYGGDNVISVFFVRNESPLSRNVTINYFSPSGGVPSGSGVDTCFLGPNQWCPIHVFDPNRIPTGTNGSAIVSSGEGVSVVVVQQKSGSVDSNNAVVPNTVNG